MTSTITRPAGAMRWDEPAGAASPRGWLMAGGMCVGFYLDYGPDHYRTGHATEIYPGKVVSFCQPGRLCRDCQPGSILACRYPGGPRSEQPRESRYVETISQARQYVTTGRVAAREAMTYRERETYRAELGSRAVNDLLTENYSPAATAAAYIAGNSAAATILNRA